MKKMKYFLFDTVNIQTVNPRLLRSCDFFFPSEFYVHINENVYICIYLNKKYICNYIHGFWNLLSIIQLHLDTFNFLSYEF